jgi:hypothetical protein
MYAATWRTGIITYITVGSDRRCGRPGYAWQSRSSMTLKVCN